MNLLSALISSLMVYLLIIPTKQYCSYWHVQFVFDDDDIFGMTCTDIVDVIENKERRYVVFLHISESDIHDVTYELLRNYSHVESMSMRTSNITNIEADAFKNFRRLESLDLKKNFIQIFPNNTFNDLHRLILLDLSDNSITTIDENPLNGLDELYHLFLRNNNIFTVSPLLVNCKGLRRLDVSQNNISRIHLTDVCSNLTYLNISRNHLTEINIDTTNTSMINELDLSWNNLDNFNNDSLKNMDYLTDLNLSNNPLFQEHDIPINLFQNKRDLKHLNLSATGIRNVAARIFADLRNLSTLDLSSNYLKTLPENVFYGLYRLKTVNLRNNRFIFWKTKNYPKSSNISCGTLTNIIQKYQSIHAFIVPGYMHNITNVRGIGCTDLDANSKSNIVWNQSQTWILFVITIVLLFYK